VRSRALHVATDPGEQPVDREAEPLQRRGEQQRVLVAIATATAIL
jgi:hypothetical protein